MSQMYPEIEETPEAAAGTASHWLGAIFITNTTKGIFDVSPLSMKMTAPNNVVLDDEMIEAAEMYADDVNEVMRKTGNFNPQVEQRIAMPMIHELSWGTPDCWFFDRATGHLYIWDYKFGYGIVEVFENWQLINYVAGILAMLDVADEYITIHFRIVQPRAFHRDGPIREWVVNAAGLRGYFNQLEARAHEALSANAVTRSGPHCKHCTARHACTAALQGGVQLYEVAAQPMPVTLPADALGVQLAIVQRAIKQLEYIESGMHAQVEATIKNGTLVPGYILESSTGHLKWTKPDAEVLALGDALNFNLRKKEAVITPTQALKLGVDDSVISAYSERPNTGVKLVPDNGNKAKRMFNNGN